MGASEKMAADTSVTPSHTVLLELLAVRFARERATVVLKHYLEMSEELQLSRWESATVKAGKFVEAVLKCLLDHAGLTVPADKQFKVEAAITDLGQTPKTAMSDSIRLTIPRACRFVYEIASNRGARHDSSEIDPNVMDANGVSSACSWVLAELLRYSQKGRVSPPEAVDLVARLTEKKYPLFEEIDGRLYFAKSGLGARRLALLLLGHRHPNRMSRAELIESVVRHGESKDNARKGVGRLRDVTDDDGNGNLKLRTSGLEEADRLLASQLHT
jgi:hypothetical protein